MLKKLILDRKIIAITGATKGIGRAIASRFAREGFAVAACARHSKDLDELENSLKQSGAQEVCTSVCDVTNLESLRSFAGKIRSELGVPDILVNNAGLFLPGEVLKEEEGVFDLVMKTNLDSAYHFSRMLVPEMRERGSGYVFNICSTASKAAYVNGGSYCIAKHALLGMSKVMREELKNDGVKVSSVLPGPTYTASWSESGIEESRFMQAEEVAEMIFSAWNLPGNAVVEELIMRPQLGDI